MVMKKMENNKRERGRKGRERDRERTASRKAQRHVGHVVRKVSFYLLNINVRVRTIQNASFFLNLFSLYYYVGNVIK